MSPVNLINLLTRWSNSVKPAYNQAGRVSVIERQNMEYGGRRTEDGFRISKVMFSDQKINSSNRFAKSLATFVLIAIFVISCAALVPNTLSVKAATARQIPLTIRVIKSNTRTPIDDGSYTVRYSIYSVDRTTADAYPSDSDSASRLWSETKTVTAKNGILFTQLGSTTAFPSSLDFSSTSLYIGIRINTDSELVPRRQLGSVTNAINSDKLQNMETGTGANSIIYSNSSGSVSVSSAPVASSTASLLQLGSSISAGSSNGTYLGVNSAAGYTGDMINLQVNGTSIFKVDASGNVTAAGIISGGTSGTFVNPVTVTTTTSPQLKVGYDGSNYFTASVSSSGATTFDAAGTAASFIFGKSVSVSSLSSSGGVSAASVSSTGTIQGATLSDGTATISSGVLTATSAVLNKTSGNAFAVTGAPTASSTSSLLQIGSAIVGGDASANGGTYIGLNASGSGAGSAADLVNLQVNGASKLKVDTSGNVFAGTINSATISGGSLTGGSVSGGTISGGTVSGGSLSATAVNGLSVAAGVISVGTWQGSTIGVTYGGTGLNSVATGDMLYGSAANTISKLSIGISGQCLTVSAGGVPEWGACGGTDITLQDAYDNVGGNTITTTSAKDISFTLANTAVDSNFVINIATGSTSQFKIQSNSSDVFTVDSSGNVAADGSISASSFNLSGGGTIGASGENITVNSSLIPGGSGINIGSSSSHFATGYFDNISIGTTDVNGTTSTSFTLDSAQTGNNVDNIQLQYYLGPTLSTYSTLQWTGSLNRFDLYSRLNTSTYATIKVGSLQTADASATALTVAPSTSSTNYAFQVDTSASSAATGVKITAAAAASGVDISAISSGTNENLTINAKGSGTITFGNVSTGNIILGTDGGNIGIGGAPGAYKLDVSGTSRFVGLLTVSSGGASITGGLTLADTGLTIQGGGASIVGGINNNSGGITNTGAISGATTGSFSGALSAASVSATGGVSGASVSATGAVTGGSLTDGTATLTGGSLTATAATLNRATGNALAVTGAPTASATSSLIQLGNAIVGGNASANGGTYIGLNAPSSGAGSVADLANWQVNGTSMFKVDASGNLTIAGTFSGGTSGSQGYWTRTGTTLSPTTSGDSLTIGTILTPSSTNLALQPTTGIVAINTSGVQNYLRVYDSAQTNYVQLTDDGTNAVLSTNSGELQLTGSGTSQFILGQSGTAVNLLFQESSTIGGADSGGKTLTFGVGADVLNFNVNAATYNFGTLTALTGLVVTNSSTNSTSLTVNSSTGQTANLLDLKVNSSSVFSVSASGATTSTGSTISGNESIAGNLAITSSNTTQTGSSAGFYLQGNSLTTGNLADISSSSITSGNLMKLTVTSTAGTASSSFKALNLAVSGANANTAVTAYGLYSSVTNTNATSGTNVAAYLTASGATTANYALQIAAGQLISQTNGAASTPAEILTGTWYSGGTATTTKPQLLVEPSGTTSTGWSTSGTGIGVNAASGFAGNLTDLQVAGASKFSVNASGNTIIAGTLDATLAAAGTGTALVINGTSIIPQSSSSKYKTNISTKQIDKTSLLSLRAVDFTWNQNSSTPGVQDFGLIAEETNNYVPDLVIRNSSGEITGVKYNQLAVLYLPILQEHDAFINDASSKINTLLTTTASLQSQLNNMATVISTSTLNATTITSGAVNAGTVLIRPANAADTALVITAAQNQTGDLLSIKSSDLISVFTIDATGKIASGNSLPGIPTVGVDPNSGKIAGDLTSSDSALKTLPDSGLKVKIAAGSVYTSDDATNPTKISRCTIKESASLTMSASSTEFVYLTSSGGQSTGGQLCEVHKSSNVPVYNANFPTVVIAKTTTNSNSILNIVDTRFFIGGTFVYANTATAIEPASAVVNDTSADNQVKQTSQTSMSGAAGVIVVGNSASGQAIMMTSGQTFVKAVLGASRNTCAITSTTAGAVDSTEVGGVNQCFGAVKTNASSLLPSVLINLSLN